MRLLSTLNISTLGKAMLCAVLLFSATTISATPDKKTKQQIEANLQAIETRTEPDSAKFIQLVHQTIDLAEQAGDFESVPKAYHYLIAHMMPQMKTEELYEEFVNMRKFVKQTGKGTQELYSSWQNFVVRFYSESNPLRAMTEFHEMEQLAKEHNDDYGLACAYTAIGAISEFAYDKGIESFNKALKHIKRAGRKEKEYYIYYGMADLSFNNKRYDEVLRYTDLMQQAEVKVGRADLYASCLKLMTYYQKDDKENATKVFEHMQKKLENNEVPPAFMSGYGNSMCMYICRWGNPRDARKYIDMIIDDDQRLKAEVTYYKAMGDYRTALTMTETFDSLKEEKMIEEQRSKVVNATAFYENKSLIAKNMALEIASTKSRNAMLIGLLVIIAIAAAVITIIVRRHNRRLRAERAKAVHLSEMKSVFIHNMAHEVRTPLNSIIGFNELLHNPDYSFSEDERKEMVSHINSHSEQLLHQLDNVICLSRIDGNDIKPNIEKVSVADVVYDACENVRDKLSQSVKIEVDVPSDITINTDQEIIDFAINEVVGNAAKFTKEGKIRIEAERISDDAASSAESKLKVNSKVSKHFDSKEASPTIRISVSDTGIGIPAGTEATIFERFEKCDRIEYGFGIGLSCAQELLRHVGGKISLDSRYSGGARFIIEI